MGQSSNVTRNRNGQQSAATVVDDSPAADDLIEELKATADKLARDGASRGDLKILCRTMRELRYAFKIFAPYRYRRKVTVFGSARTPTDADCYQQAVEFGQEMARHDWMVITGAASGIREAGHAGAGREHAMGVNIMLPFEQEANPVIAGDHKLMHLKYFFTRKLLFVKECHAVALFPGGFGTLDEGFEVLTLLQTGKRDLMPLVLIDEPGGKYWLSWQRYVQNHLLKRGMVSPPDRSLYHITDDVNVAVEEILKFYSVYHSMRYVGDRLVLRLKRAPSEELLEEIRSEFPDILVDGTFELSSALPNELNEHYLRELPRLVFQFDRKSLGRLRQLIDKINRGVPVGPSGLPDPMPAETGDG